MRSLFQNVKGLVTSRWIALPANTQAFAATMALLTITFVVCALVTFGYRSIDRWMFNRSLAPIEKTIQTETQASQASEANANVTQSKQTELEGEEARQERIVTSHTQRVQESRRKLNEARTAVANTNNLSIVERQHRLCSTANELNYNVGCSNP